MYPYHSTNNFKQHTNFNVPQLKNIDVIPLSDHNHNSKQTLQDTRMWHAIPIAILFGEVGAIDSPMATQMTSTVSARSKAICLKILL
jgi:hypothetical protein